MTEGSRTWRPHPIGRTAAWVYIAVFAIAVVAGTIIVIVDGQPGLLVVAVVGGHPMLLLSVLGALRPYVRADEGGLHVQNPIRRLELSWAEITEVLPGYHGLEITTRDGEMEIAWAVQKSNLAGWLKRPTRADDAAVFLQQTASKHRADGSAAA